MITNEKNQGDVFRLFFVDDLYRLRDANLQRFDIRTIFDIGANIGFHALLARALFPKAKIIAVEPAAEAFSYLEKNMGMLDVETLNVAIGIDGEMFFKPHDSGHILAHQFSPSDTGNYSVRSMRLQDLFNMHHKGGEYLVKSNAEGVERYWIDDEETWPIFRRSLQTTIHTHFKPMNRPEHPHKDFPRWEEYVEWMDTVFSRTHSIEYHMSSRRRATGFFTMKSWRLMRGG